MVEGVDDNGVVGSFEYDELDRLTLETDARGNTVAYAYNKTSQVLAVTETDLNQGGTVEGVYETLFWFDELGRVTTEVDSLGHTQRFAYDSRGNVVFESDANNTQLTSISSLPYQGHPSLSGQGTSQITLINGHGNTTVYDYDDADRLVATHYHLRAGADGKNSVHSTVTTERAYDDNGRVTVREDGEDNPIQYFYDAHDRNTRIEYDDGTAETFTYDERSLIKTHIDQNLTTTSYEYDDAGRIERITANGAAVPSTEELHAYDALDRPKSIAVTDESSIQYSYDLLSNVTSEVQDHLDGEGGTVSATYDGVGNLRSITHPSGQSVYYGYDFESNAAGLNRVTSIARGASEASASPVASYTYAGGGLRTKKRIQDGNGTESRFFYDDARRVQKIEHSESHVFDQRNYTYDRIRNKLSRDYTYDHSQPGEHAVDHTFTYDSLYRLKSSERQVSGVVVANNDYTLDDAGNWRHGDFGLIGDDARVNQYTTTDRGDHYYDSNGNTDEVHLAASNLPPGVSSVESSYGYEYRNLPVSVDTVTTIDQVASTAMATYRYDGAGRRIAKTVSIPGGVVTERRYYYLGSRCITEKDLTTGDLTDYTFGNRIDERVAMHRDGADYYFHGDDIDNTVALTDASGSLVERYAYGDYGVLLDPSTMSAIPVGFGASVSTVDNEFLFNGRRLDLETGYYYYRTRYLDPVLGRFTTRDSIGVWGDPNNLGNAYSFVGGNPWRYVDPMGMGFMDWCHGALDVIGMIPAVGNIADVANAGLYALEGDFGNAVVSLAGAVPGGQAATGTRLAAKAGSAAADVAKATDKVADAAKGLDAAADANKGVKGVYEIVENGKATYVGQSKDVGRRMSEHARAKNKDGSPKFGSDAEVRVKQVEGKKVDREIAEQELIDANGGIRNLKNKRNAIGKKRRERLEREGRMRKNGAKSKGK